MGLIAIVLAGIGFFTDTGWLFIVGGLLAISTDVYGFLSGKLSPVFPIILYIAGFIIFGGWHGILRGALIGSLFEVTMVVIFLLGGGAYAMFGKSTNTPNQ